MQIRIRARAEGVVGMPGIRVVPAASDAGDYEIVVEDRAEPGDAVHETQGIKLYLGPQVAEQLAGATLDVSGDAFVFRMKPPA